MLEFNPYFRPTAEQLLKEELFEDIRSPEHEITVPFKFNVGIDKNEFAFNYDTYKPKTSKNDRIIIMLLKKEVMKEIAKFN